MTAIRTADEQGVTSEKRFVKTIVALLLLAMAKIATAADAKSVNMAIDWLKTACASGNALEIKVERDGGISLLKKGLHDKLYFSQKDARGTVPGLQGELQRDNLREQRECMRPYVARVPDAILGNDAATSSVTRPPYDVAKSKAPVNIQISHEGEKLLLHLFKAEKAERSDTAISSALGIELGMVHYLFQKLEENGLATSPQYHSSTNSFLGYSFGTTEMHYYALTDQGRAYVVEKGLLKSQ